jgi:hypothetical protein
MHIAVVAEKQRNVNFNGAINEKMQFVAVLERNNYN